MKLIVHPDADKELHESIDYYSEINKNLGKRFWNEFQNGVNRIKFCPDAWPLHNKKYRRFLLNRFPYAIIYRIHIEIIEIIAVMHLKRKPGYWVSRITIQ